jgi:peptidoglycan/xylan/chitin deacetylase (PgdA/CDA1 family)
MPGRRWSRVDRILNAIKQLPSQERRLIADSLDGRSLAPELRMLTRMELISLASDSLVSIGNHTRGHELLDQLTLDDARATISAAQDDLATCSVARPRHFCYPNGGYLAETVHLVHELGFVTATTTVPGIWTDADKRLEIPRLSVGRFDSLARFRAQVLQVAGLPTNL